MIRAARLCGRAAGGSASRPTPATVRPERVHRAGDTAWRRLGRRCATVAALAVAAFALLPAPAAGAHPTVQATTPPAGYSLAEAPREITLDFSEPVGLVTPALRLTSSDGRPVATSAAALSENGRRVSAAVEEELAPGPGVYPVAWQVRGDDGDLVSGVFSFAVGVSVVDGDSAAAPIGEAGGSAPLKVPAAALRWMLFAAVALGLGGAAGTLLVGRIRREATTTGDSGVELAPVPAPAFAAAVLGLAATAGLILVGGYSVAEVLESRPGRLLGIELAAFAATAGIAGLARVLGRPRLRTAAATPLLAVLAAEALRAHVSAARPLAGAVLTAVHLLAAALWIGGLLQVLRAAARWHPESAWTRLLLFDYARTAVWLVLALFATGTVQGLLLVPTAAELFGTGYGRVLLAKLAVVVLAIGCAVLARRGLRRPVQADSHPVGRAVRIEIAALVSVLAITGALTSLTPPAQAAAGVTLPPPPVGPALPVGSLAGQVTVAATASAGRLVMRLSTPLDGPFDDPPESPPYRLTAQAAPGRDLALASCGIGCFTASVDWRPGTTSLALEVTAPPWSGGKTTLDIAWPPRPGLERFDRVLAAMRAAGPFTLREATTSDYRGDPGTPLELAMTGAEFIELEPYAEGSIDPVVVRDKDGEGLAFAFPANGIVVRLWLDETDRIRREVLISPNHLISRTFDYGPQ